MASMTTQPIILIIPGWQDSGPGHWQSLWAESLVGSVRVHQDNWIHPNKKAWVDRIHQSILSLPAPVILVAHSLGCIASVHLPKEVHGRIHGALFVAPADPERKAPLVDFAPVPYQKLSYRSILVASSNDPFCPPRTAAAYARSWGSEFVRLQNAGHINIESELGAWPLGLALLQSLQDEPLAMKDKAPALKAEPSLQELARMA
jgi:predicted alpha/beta hydrolase family esterase